MRNRLLAALLILIVGGVAYEAFASRDASVKVTEDGTPPPSWP